MSPPLKTFISANSLKGKKLAFFVSSGGGSDKKCFAKMHKLTGAENAPCLSVVDMLKNKNPDDAAKVKAFAEKVRGM